MPHKLVLLVEDDRDLSDILDLALLAKGYAVQRADTAAGARQRIESMRYDLVIADWRLPDGDGLDIADLAADRGAKTILISGYLFQVPAERLARHEVMMKPMRPSEPTKAVERLIGASGGGVF